MMSRSRSIALEFNEVRNLFEHWRQSRHGKSPIPDELWSAAIELARRAGVNQTAAALHLDGGKLKRLMLAADSISGKTSSPRFVELMAPHSVVLPECKIELECRSGKLRIHWKGATAADLAGLSRALWDAVAS